MNIKNRTIFCRDNLEVMRGIDDACIDLIYLDPPFNKKKKFIGVTGTVAEGASFYDYFHQEDVKDEWLGLIADKYSSLYNYIQGISDVGHKSNKYYLCYMAVRLLEMHRILKDTGSIYLHCDQTMSHYLRLLMDSIFGQDNFQNNIAWCYSSQSQATKWFPRKHDEILFYTKGASWTFNADADPIRVPYKLDKMPKRINKHTRTGSGQWKGGTETELLDRHSKGKLIEDWWVITFGPNSPERTGYPTQKPLALLIRIIEASSKSGDIILDPFCGCATTCVAAEKLERKWIGIDVSDKAYDLVKLRLEQEVPSDMWRGQVTFRKDIPTPTKEQTRPKLDDRHHLFGKQLGRCNGCKTRFDHFRHFHLDHIVPKARGGADHLSNYQLLCGSCNSIKGTHDMPYLLARLKERGILPQTA